MGYTLYWERPAQLAPHAFARAVADCRRMVPATQIPLAGPDGTGAPLLLADAVIFNGEGPASGESFDIRLTELPRRDGRGVFSFCKTDRYPYDLAAKAALIVFQHHVGAGFYISCDGASADWQAARELCQQHLGYGGDFTRTGD